MKGGRTSGIAKEEEQKEGGAGDRRAEDEGSAAASTAERSRREGDEEGEKEGGFEEDSESDDSDDAIRDAAGAVEQSGKRRHAGSRQQKKRGAYARVDLAHTAAERDAREQSAGRLRRGSETSGRGDGRRGKNSGVVVDVDWPCASPLPAAAHKTFLTASSSSPAASPKSSTATASAAGHGYEGGDGDGLSSSPPAALPAPPPPPPLTLSSVLIAGAGFMCDAYDLFIMNVVLVVMGCDASSREDGGAAGVCELSAVDKSSLASAVLVGSIAGQLAFGVLADTLGRRRGFITTLSILIVGAALSAAAQPVGGLSLVLVLSLARFVLGVGVGGEYPLSATVSSEASSATAGRGRRVALVFSMQGVGLILAPLVVLVLLASRLPYAQVWRLALGLGALPGLVMIAFRCRMKESEAFTAAKEEERRRRERAARQEEAAAAVEETEGHLPDSPASLSSGPSSSGASSSSSSGSVASVQAALMWGSRWDLLACAGNWFIFDVVFYANALFSSEVTKDIIRPPTDAADADAVHAYLVQVATSTLLLGLCALPGYFGATLVIDRWGRRRLQLFGYAGMCASYIVCALALRSAASGAPPSEPLFYFLYGLSFFFSNMGPNTTTFVIPAEIFPTLIRSSCHGISAASGKAGAAIGTALMPALFAWSDHSLSTVMAVSAGISLIGFAFTAALTRESQHTDIAHSSSSSGSQQQHAAAHTHADDGRSCVASEVALPSLKGTSSSSSSSQLSPPPKRSRLGFAQRVLRGARGYTALLKAQAEEEEEDVQAEGVIEEDELAQATQLEEEDVVVMQEDEEEEETAVAEEADTARSHNKRHAQQQLSPPAQPRPTRLTPSPASIPPPPPPALPTDVISTAALT